MNEQDLPKHVHLSHAPADSHLASSLAEGLKKAGFAVVSRTIQPRGRSDDSVEAEEFRRRAQPYLKKLKGPDPLEMDLRVYLSYATEDFEDVFRFHLELLRMGMFTFLDQSEIMGIHMGEDWMKCILQNLSTCCSLACFLSPHSLQSAFMGHEVSFFLERMRLRSGCFLCVVLMQKMEIGALGDLGVPVIEFYRLSAKDAAKQFVDHMVEFYQKPTMPSGHPKNDRNLKEK